MEAGGASRKMRHDLHSNSWFVGQGHGKKAVVELLPQRTGGGQQVGLVLAL